MKNTTYCRNQNFGFKPSLKKWLRRTRKWSVFDACLASPDLQVSGGRVYFARFFLFRAGIPDCAKFTLSAPADPLVTIKCSGNEVKVATYIISPVSLCSYTFIYYSSFYRFLLIFFCECDARIFFALQFVHCLIIWNSKTLQLQLLHSIKLVKANWTSQVGTSKWHYTELNLQIMYFFINTNHRHALNWTELLRNPD